jgi:hypothetical protein
VELVGEDVDLDVVEDELGTVPTREEVFGISTEAPAGVERDIVAERELAIIPAA